jgi:hypothetical protein
LKVRPDFFSLSNANRWRQQRIAAAPELLRREVGIRLKIYDLTPGVDAGICPPCSLHIQALLRQLLYHTCKEALNRRLAGLDLPASEIGSVVGNRQLDIVHRPGIIAREVRYAGSVGVAKERLSNSRQRLDARTILGARLDAALSKLKKRC